MATAARAVPRSEPRSARFRPQSLPHALDTQLCERQPPLDVRRVMPEVELRADARNAEGSKHRRRLARHAEVVSGEERSQRRFDRRERRAVRALQVPSAGSGGGGQADGPQGEGSGLATGGGAHSVNTSGTFGRVPKSVMLGSVVHTVRLNPSRGIHGLPLGVRALTRGMSSRNN